MFALYAKAIAFKPKPCDRLPITMPPLVREKLISIRAKHCDRYNALTHWDNCFAAVVHPNYIQTLSLPLQLDMMVDKAFPFKPMGLVHLANKIEVNCLPDQTATLRIKTEFANVYLHRKGWLFELVTSAGYADIDVTNETLVKATSYYLARTKHDLTGIDLQANQYKDLPKWLKLQRGASQMNIIEQQMRNAKQSDIDTENHSEDLYFSANVGRKYAKVSGDFNPIHLHPLTAKILGFKKAIVHGMYSKAWVLSKIAHQQAFYKQPFTVKIVFHQPIALPANTVLQYSTQLPGVLGTKSAEQALSSDLRFWLMSKGQHKERMHLSGQIEPLEKI